QIEGVVMTVPDPVTSPGEPIRVHLRSVGKERNLVVGAYTRGKLSDVTREPVTVKPGDVSELKLMATPDPRAVRVRIPGYAEPTRALKPVAERLVCRRPGEMLNLTFTTSGTRASPDVVGFVPGLPVELNVGATDEKGNPAAAILWAAAVNTADAPGPKDRLLTTPFLLAGEVGTPDALEYADFLLTEHPKAAQALDLVLATQGWRRFAEQTPAPVTRKPVVVTPEQVALHLTNGQYPTVAEPGW